MKEYFMRKAKIVLAVFVLMLAMAAPSWAAMSLKAGHTLTPEHPYHLGLVKFGEIIKEKTGGEITLDAFHSSQLGSERELIEAMQMGTVDMAVISTAPLAGFTKSFLVYDLPFIFPDSATAHKVLDGEIGQKSLADLDKIGIIGLAFYENGFRQVTNSKRALVKPEDAKGLKIRTMENKIHMASFRAVGANPVPMAFGELFTALQQRTIDAQENPLPIIFNNKFYEVQEFCSMTNHFYSPAPLLMSKAVWNKLTPEQQTIFKEAAVEARAYQREELAKQDAAFVKQLEENGMKINQVDHAAWLKAMEPVYKQFEKEIGADLIKAVQDSAN
ncbi:C4-dicarboxylate ABC transporter substrate-binding protein [Deltaproteobacteria bacterium Smac51]|nr:C4-dicarboxylate ABC transporter substrate-binding protein [Deltaproteobacteria bacterium Smac51]